MIFNLIKSTAAFHSFILVATFASSNLSLELEESLYSELCWVAGVKQSVAERRIQNLDRLRCCKCLSCLHKGSEVFIAKGSGSRYSLHVAFTKC